MVVAQSRMAHQRGYIDGRHGCIDSRCIRGESGVTESVRLPQQIHRIGRWACQLHRRRADPAVAHDHCGDSLRQLCHHLRIADNTGIVMRMDVDEAGREHPPAALRDLVGDVVRKLPDCADKAGIDGNIGGLSFAPAAVEHANVPDESVTKHMSTYKDIRTLQSTKPETIIEPFHKGLGWMQHAMEPSEIVQLGWNLLREDLSLPAAILSHERLLHNLRWMEQFIAAYGLKLAPHGKTTMAPKLFGLQLEAGAWGITLATPHQALVAYNHGVRRVLMANQLVGKQNLALIARLLEDPDFEYFCLVDSAQQVEHLGEFFRASGRRLPVGV